MCYIKGALFEIQFAYSYNLIMSVSHWCNIIYTFVRDKIVLCNID